MSSKNRYECIGRIVREPEYGVTKTNTSYCRFTIAMNRKFKGKDGKNVSSTFFINATAWGTRAKFVNEYISKGHLVYAEGALSNNKWEDREGNMKDEIIMTVSDIIMLERKFKEGAGEYDEDGDDYN